MGTVKPPLKGILFTSLLYNKTVEPENVFEVLEKEFGSIILTSTPFVFKETDYYKNEMGPDLTRVFAAFDYFIEGDRIADIKIKTNRIEDTIFSAKRNRTVNIDPGYVTNAKVVLATTKNFQHRIYMKKGIFAEITLRYRGKSYEPWEWTFKDYRLKESIDFFNNLRAVYRAKVNELIK
ncbi:MAG TPA: DUF4416 family protein [Spirochaetes bacterium]|nr:DUF4416 family protein [Spirochaetota bacterium]